MLPSRRWYEFAPREASAGDTLRARMTQAFYDELAPYYHLLYPDWEASMARQSRGLATVLSEFDVPADGSLLDAACGVGTQALGLSALGYRVTASDLSPGAIARAAREADARGLHIDFHVADFRRLGALFGPTFHATLACDNAIPHLLSDAEIATAFAQCRGTLVPGGVFLVSVRDYATIERRTPDIRSYGNRTVGTSRYSVEQVWEWEGDQYRLTLRLTETTTDGSRIAHEFQSRYYAVELPTLERLLHEVGFARVERRDEQFFQPLLVAINAPAS